jgi:hypothetical protein
MESCPHCGSEAGFYRVVVVSGKGRWHYGFKGESVYNGEFHDSFNYRDQKSAFCSDCEKEIRQLRSK